MEPKKVVKPNITALVNDVKNSIIPEIKNEKLQKQTVIPEIIKSENSQEQTIIENSEIKSELVNTKNLDLFHSVIQKSSYSQDRTTSIKIKTEFYDVFSLLAKANNIPVQTLSNNLFHYFLETQSENIEKNIKKYIKNIGM